MTSRTTRKTVTFRRPFALSGVDGTQPPGVYDVDTDEESIDSLSILAYRRVATLIQVRRNGETQVFPIDPVELDAALMRDAGQAFVSPGERSGGDRHTPPFKIEVPARVTAESAHRV